MSFRPSVIIQPQFVATGSAAKLSLTVSLAAAAATGTVVPDLNQIFLGSVRFVNMTAGAVTLKVWRAPSAAPTAIDVNVVIPTVTIPVATESNPYFDWSPNYYLAAGDAIWAIASSASAISVSGDGALVTQ